VCVCEREREAGPSQTTFEVSGSGLRFRAEGFGSKVAPEAGPLQKTFGVSGSGFRFRVEG